MVNIPKPNPEMVARIKAEREAAGCNAGPTFAQQVEMARSLTRQGENWMELVRDPEMRRRIQGAL